MSISGIPSSAFNPYQLGTPTSLQQQDFQQLGKDLQSGNLSSAQSDFAILQQAFSQPSTASGTAVATTFTATSSPITQAFNQLSSDLQSGNLTAAQKDYSTLQQDLQSPGGVGHHLHNHHRIRTPGVGDSGNQNPLLQDLNQLGQSLTSGNLTGAQQGYSTLQQELQQFAFGGGALSSESPMSLEA
ncbi:MAG TPA: hypothetical protein VJX69_05705 [Terriglobales bacterium]|nr:hypothetical protein [Terriglobales bacterium]